MASILSVHVGRPREAAWTGLGRTSIDKTAVTGPVHVGPLGLDGDQVSNRRHHGGRDKAVYAFAREDLDRWGAELGAELPDGLFGENLTTQGYDVNEAEIGERWAVGEVLLEVASVRTPCGSFASWMARNGYDATTWVKRFALEARPGPYLRVRGEGALRASDELRVVHQPGHGVTVSTMLRAPTTEPGLLPELLRVPGLGPEARARAEAHVARST